MQDLLTHPAFQAAIAPLISGFAVALVLRQLNVRWQGLAVLVGFLVTVQLTIGIEFLPMTSTRKIIFCSLLLPFTPFLLDRFACRLRCKAVFLAITLAVAAVWIVWPVLGRQEGPEAWLIGGRVSLYAAAIGAGLVWLTRGSMVREAGASLALGIGTGAVTLIASSALYGQLAFSVSTALGGLLLVILLKLGKRNATESLGDISLFAVAIPLALIGGAGTVFARLPAIALLCLAFVPVFASLPVGRLLKVGQSRPGRFNLWVQVGLATLMGLIPAVPAIWLAWESSAPMDF